jgi:Anti-sigma-K factor rskA
VPHCDPDVLALRALGEEVGPAEADAHLAECAQCRAELEELRHVVRSARSGSPDDLPQAAPAHVWEGIRAELGLPETLVPSLAAAPVTAAVQPGEPATGTPEPVGGEPTGAPGTDELAAARHRRLRRLPTAPLLAAAAAVGAVAGGLGVWALTDGSTDQPAPEVVATTPLEPLPTWDVEGTASVEVAADGSRLLVVEVPGAGVGEADGYHEVWLLDPDVTQLVSLGVLEGDSGTFAIPAALELDELPVVDVSLEPYDGDPAHSGDSVVRGTLQS